MISRSQAEPVARKRLFLRAATFAYSALGSSRLRALAFNAYARMVRHRRKLATIDGSRFDLDLGETIDLCLYLGKWEPDVTAAIRKHVRPGMTVFDIGANIGVHTLLFATLVGREGRVIAFEPTDYAFAKLQRNLALNDLPQVKAVKIALSDHHAEREQIAFRASWPTSGRRKDAPCIVDFERLDAWCAAEGVQTVDVIKLDVDGNEFPILSGGMATITRCRPLLLIEAVGPHFDDEARNPYRVLAEAGYRFRDLRSGRAMTLEDLRNALPRGDAAMSVSLDVLAMPEERCES